MVVGVVGKLIGEPGSFGIKSEAIAAFGDAHSPFTTHIVGTPASSSSGSGNSSGNTKRTTPVNHPKGHGTCSST